MIQERTLQEPIAEEPAPPALVTVTVTAPLREQDRDYRPGELLEIPEARAHRLAQLGLVAWPREARPWWKAWMKRTPDDEGGRRRR
jgi:hypothetical protein